MPAVRTVLVVGAGTAGIAAAILLAERGVAVDVVELKPGIAASGSGITLQGNALRVLRRLGVWEAAQRKGYAFDGLGLRAPDPAGTLIAEIPDLRTGGEDLPATLGMSRPDLAGVLLDRADQLGVTVRFGSTFSALRQDADGVDVTFDDGSTARYDLVVGADGVRSAARAAIGVQLETRRTGMGIWRAFLARPASVTRTDLFYGGPIYLAGYCPTGEDSMYCYLVEPAQDRSALSADQRLAVMRGLSTGYHGPWDDIRELLTDPGRINYAYFETHLLDRPWNRGRVVLIGDAAHTCPPTVAQGVALALEDAEVLAELLLAADQVDDALWTAFMDRRYDRVRTVVDASVQLGQWMLDHVRGDAPGLIRSVAELVSRPA